MQELPYYWNIATIAVPMYDQVGQAVDELTLAEMGILFSIITRYHIHRNHNGMDYDLPLDNVSALCKGYGLFTRERAVKKFLDKHRELLEIVMDAQRCLEIPYGKK